MTLLKPVGTLLSYLVTDPMMVMLALVVAACLALACEALKE